MFGKQPDPLLGIGRNVCARHQLHSYGSGQNRLASPEQMGASMVFEVDSDGQDAAMVECPSVCSSKVSGAQPSGRADAVAFKQRSTDGVTPAQLALTLLMSTM